MPCPPHPIELMAMSAKDSFRRWVQLVGELEMAHGFARKCLRAAGTHGEWVTVRQELAGTEDAQLTPFQSTGRMDADGPVLEAYLAVATAALRAIEERLCVLRTSLARLARAGEIPPSRPYAREMERHLEHREGERRMVLAQHLAHVRAPHTLPAAMRDRMLAEIERVRSIPDATLLCDRQCLVRRG
jgi:hypothetical protein